MSATGVAEETLRDWLKAYRMGGFDALKPRPRNGVGQSRALPRHVQDLLISTKENIPSVQMVIKEARTVKEHCTGNPLVPLELAP